MTSRAFPITIRLSENLLIYLLSVYLIYLLYIAYQKFEILIAKIDLRAHEKVDANSQH